MAEAGIATTPDPERARSVVVGLDLAMTYDTIRRAADAITHGAAFIATNTDATYPVPGGVWPGAGSLVAAIETASGVTPLVVGKPHEPIRALIRGRVGSGPVVVVGDRPETDLALAADTSWRTVLVLTGVTDDPSGVRPVPSAVLASLSELPDYLNGENR